MRTVKAATKANPVAAKARRPRSAMNAFGRKMADAIEKAAAANRKPMSMDEIEREVIRRRGGIYQ